MGADKPTVATEAVSKAAERAPSLALGHERLVRSLTANIHALDDAGPDAEIFRFLTTRDPHIVDGLKAAADWVMGHPDGVGELDAQAIAERQPQALARLCRLAIARALGTLAATGSLWMPTFEHDGNRQLIGDLRRRVASSGAGRVPVDDLEEAVMRAVAGAPTPGAAPEVRGLAELVDALAARPVDDQADIVAMAVELALEAQATRPAPGALALGRERQSGGGGAGNRTRVR